MALVKLEIFLFASNLLITFYAILFAKLISHFKFLFFNKRKKQPQIYLET